MKKKLLKYIFLYTLTIILFMFTIFSTTSYLILHSKNEALIQNLGIYKYYDEPKINYNEYNPQKDVVDVLNIKFKHNEKLENYVNENKYIFDFYTNSFLIEENYLIELFYKLNTDDYNFNEKNVFKLDTEFNSLDEQIEYYINHENTTLKLETDRMPNNDSKEYIIALIDYFSKFFPDVDTNIAKAIANVESGYTHDGMLYANNIHGGLSSGSLIYFDTIEHGVYEFLSLLDRGYFSQGLNTVESIGYKYNPVMENGVKKANPSWVIKVNNILPSFSKNDVSLEEVIKLKGAN